MTSMSGLRQGFPQENTFGLFNTPSAASARRSVRSTLNPLRVRARRVGQLAVGRFPAEIRRALAALGVLKNWPYAVFLRKTLPEA